jgi:hypothetical protein
LDATSITPAHGRKLQGSSSENTSCKLLDDSQTEKEEKWFSKDYAKKILT